MHARSHVAAESPAGQQDYDPSREQPSAFPAIKGSRVVTRDDATKHIQVVLPTSSIMSAARGGITASP